MLSTPQTLLMLGGAGLPTWVWEDVRAATAHLGATAVAPRLPRDPQASLSTLADAAAAASPGPLTVVAHSSGACVAAELVARHPGRVTAFLGLSAVIPDVGRSFVQSMPFPARAFLSLAVLSGRTRPPDTAIRAGLTSGLSAALADRIVADFEPEPRGLFAGRCSPRTWPAVRSYIVTTRDRELTPGVQHASARRLQVTPESLDTGHLPMLEDPAGVAAAISRLLLRAV